MERFIRTSLLIGEDNLQKLKNSKVAVFGAGGVGGYAIEALARSGVGSISVFDNDSISKSNINRQIIATDKTVGLSKAQAFKERVLSINPDIEYNYQEIFYLPENADSIDLSIYDYVIDAVDTVTAKIEIIRRAKEVGTKVISCMGTGGKTDITQLKVSDIHKTKTCPLARVMRRELSSLNIKDVKVVYSEEQVIVCEQSHSEVKADGKSAPPSIIFVPATAGLMLAREVVFDLINR